MKKQIPQTQAEAIQYAIDWQNWVSEQNLSIGELIEWQGEFQAIAEQFDLVDEFIENGII